ncbi:MAG: glycosyltransferase family 4 protein [Bacteroidales bacterium]|jgi:glycosyltransferase involved in cell wall biosynthesis
MRIVYLITGSGGSFYCGNCYRDVLYLRAIRKVPGVSAKAIPLYLPPGDNSQESGLDNNVFFGAITMYLRDKVRFMRNMPSFFDSILNSGPLLKLAARQAGTTRTEGFEGLTLNMISGESAFRSDEVDRLAKYIVSEEEPDVIHLSNALVIGIARHLKKRLKAKIICSLLNEDDWIDEMAEPYRDEAWRMIAWEAQGIDLFVTPSNYFKDLFIRKTGISEDKISVIPIGFDPETDGPQRKEADRHAIGYFCRVSYQNGFDKLVDAFVRIRETIPDATLHVCGGYTGDDRPFIAEQIKKIRKSGFEKSIRIYPEFQGQKKAEFFRNVDVISVPVRKYDGYGLYILEANGAGVPVVQPSTGAFPEIIGTTGGGIIYSPDTSDELASSLVKLLKDDSLRIKLGEAGRKNVIAKLSLDRMAEGLSGIYETLVIH